MTLSLLGSLRLLSSLVAFLATHSTLARLVAKCFRIRHRGSYYATVRRFPTCAEQLGVDSFMKDDHGRTKGGQRDVQTAACRRGLQLLGEMPQVSV